MLILLFIILGGLIVIELSVDETEAPNFFSSVFIAKILSVSLTRQLAIDLRVVGPFANKARIKPNRLQCK